MAFSLLERRTGVISCLLSSQMLIRGGENIYSACVSRCLFDLPDEAMLTNCLELFREVEDAIYSYPGNVISDVAIVGIPDDMLGELVGCVCTVQPGKKVAIEDLNAHLRTKLASFKIPSTCSRFAGLFWFWANFSLDS
jgi:acyl-CoA synthetase (AMP-forming)/AMP-acid ligase II